MYMPMIIEDFENNNALSHPHPRTRTPPLQVMKFAILQEQAPIHIITKYFGCLLYTYEYGRLFTSILHFLSQS